jgi:hypothetical protein
MTLCATSKKMAISKLVCFPFPILQNREEQNRIEDIKIFCTRQSYHRVVHNMTTPLNLTSYLSNPSVIMKYEIYLRI